MPHTQLFFNLFHMHWKHETRHFMIIKGQTSICKSCVVISDIKYQNCKRIHIKISQILTFKA